MVRRGEGVREMGSLKWSSRSEKIKYSRWKRSIKRNLNGIYTAVTERVLSWDERPLEIVKQLGKDSIRQMELMRFYLQLKQDPHGPNLALFVGNLPPNLSERLYENMLMDFLGKGKVVNEKRKKK